jgi:synaptosomal-associated protein 29
MLKKRFSTSRSSTAINDDDVDDDTFLNAAKSLKPTSPYGKAPSFPSDSPSKSTFQQRYDSLEDQRTQLTNRKKEIECRAVESTQRSLSMLRDSEEVGIATAEVIIY